jgi:hypothetical protein
MFFGSIVNPTILANASAKQGNQYKKILFLDRVRRDKMFECYVRKEHKDKTPGSSCAAWHSHKMHSVGSFPYQQYEEKT